MGLSELLKDLGINITDADAHENSEKNSAMKKSILNILLNGDDNVYDNVPVSIETLELDIEKEELEAELKNALKGELKTKLEKLINCYQQIESYETKEFLKAGFVTGVKATLEIFNYPLINDSE